MAMHRVPTLILGIGGIGCRIAANISDLLTDEARERVGLVGIDTNVNDLKAVAARGMRTIQTSDNRTVGEYLMNNPQHLPWFPLNAFTASKSLLNGAGQIRAVSRLGALATEEKGGFIPIKEEIQRIRANRGDSSNGNLTVMVVGSITGGTGAGLFLQIPYYIRQIMRNEAGLKNIIIRGMFVGPDLTVDVQPSDINKAAVRVNGYSCIKELNAMYMHQMSSQRAGNLKIDFYAPSSEAEQRGIVDNMRSAWADLAGEDYDYSLEAVSSDAQIIAQGNPDVPYDYLYLIEGVNADGGIGLVPLNSVESLAARMVHTLMFTPVSNNALSVEDNMILQDAAHNGMNRYSSAGMARLVYPQELARDYVTLATVRDLVQKEWLLIDNSFQDQVIEARIRQRTDGKVKIPQIKDAYPQLFEKNVKETGALGKLFQEAFVVTPEHDELSQADIFFGHIDTLIDKVFAEDDVDAAAGACAVDKSRMNTFADANSEVNRVYAALEEYEKLAKSLVNDRPIALANMIFPPSWPSMSQNKDLEYNIYQLLHDVHPVTARFLCYKMIQLLESRIRETEALITDIDFDEYETKDYDLKTPNIQSATVALRTMEEKTIPVLGSLVSEERRINKLRMILEGNVNEQKELITGYLRNGLVYATCKVLLDRVTQLADNYAIFFSSIGTMIQENQARIAKMEEITLPLGQLGVYCSKEAFRLIAAKYQSSMSDSLSIETKSAIFESLFKILADDFINNSEVKTERQKAALAAKKSKTLGNVFSVAVVDTIRTEVIKKGAGIVDMNVHEALKRQFELEAPESDDFAQYLQDLMRKAMKIASPMVATSENAAAESTATAYIAMHPDCAATEMDKPSTGATQSLFLPTASAETGNVKVTVLLDEAFSPYEITCFRARYKFSVEDLTKYGPTSENATAYQDRIRKLGTAPVFTGNPDDGLTVINPHLDRYWHEEAYLPSLYKSERANSKTNLNKAFIYAIGLDRFDLRVDEDTLEKRLTWYYLDLTRNRCIPVKVRNSRIGNSYTDLYNSLPYNGRIKKAILDASKVYMRKKKGFTSAEELFETILDDPFIADLIQQSPDTPNCAERNVLDILLSMRNSMEGDVWVTLFSGLLEVLWEYCGFMFDKNERMVNIAVRAILDKMLSNSSIAGKNGARYVEEQVEALRQIPYRKY